MANYNLDDLCQAAASTLPEGYSIEIVLELNYGGIKLFDADYSELDFNDQHESLGGSVEIATAFAVEHAAKRGAQP